jgi:hypothetical protein
MVAAFYNFTHSNRLIFWCSGSLVVVESIRCHYAMVEANSQLKLLPPSILDIYKVFEHIDMLPICAVNRHTEAALISYPHSTVQTRQLDGDNNFGATTVTMPMQSEGKEVSGIMTIMPVQQGG